MTALATITDLAELGITPDDDQDVIERYLDVASAAVREAAGSNITQQTTTAPVPAHEYGSSRLRLPGTPVVSASSVSKGGSTIPSTLWTLVQDELYRTDAYPWRTRLDFAPPVYDVTYTVGLPEAPEDIVHLVASLAAAALLRYRDGDPVAAAAARDTSVASESYQVDDASESVSYQQGAGLTSQLTIFDIPDRTRLWLRQRFSGTP